MSGSKKVLKELIKNVVPVVDLEKWNGDYSLKPEIRTPHSGLKMNHRPLIRLEIDNTSRFLNGYTENLAKNRPKQIGRSNRFERQVANSILEMDPYGKVWKRSYKSPKKGRKIHTKNIP